MRSFLLLVAPLALASLDAGCARSEPSASAIAPAKDSPAPAPAAPQGATASAIKPLDRKKFGADITEMATTPLDTLLKEPARYGDKVVRTEGLVSAVCKQMGCWMEIADNAGLAHIKMAGHAFFVPKDASGHHAVVQGRVLSGAKDGCTEEAEQQTGQVARLQIEATGIEFVD